jgi:hypothetical protein
MRGSAPRDLLALLGCRHWRPGWNIRINVAMIAPTCTSRLAVNSTVPKSMAAIASASDPPSAKPAIRLPRPTGRGNAYSVDSGWGVSTFSGAVERSRSPAMICWVCLR